MLYEHFLKCLFLLSLIFVEEEEKVESNPIHAPVEFNDDGL